MEEADGFEGAAGAGELGDEGVPGVGIATGHVEEDGEGAGEEAATTGVGEEELGGEDDVGEEAGAEEAGMEVAKVAKGGGDMEEVKVVGEEVGGVGHADAHGFCHARLDRCNLAWPVPSLIVVQQRME